MINQVTNACTYKRHQGPAKQSREVKYSHVVKKCVLCENGEEQTLSTSPIYVSETRDAICRHGTY